MRRRSRIEVIEITLRALDGETYAKIGADYGVTRETVRKVVHQGIRMCQNFLYDSPCHGLPPPNYGNGYAIRHWRNHAGYWRSRLLLMKEKGKRICSQCHSAMRLLASAEGRHGTSESWYCQQCDISLIREAEPAGAVIPTRPSSFDPDDPFDLGDPPF